MSAPAAMSFLTTVAWPFFVARCKGVDPLRSSSVAFAWCSRRLVTICVRPRSDARCSKREPSRKIPLTLSPVAKRVWNRASSFFSIARRALASRVGCTVGVERPCCSGARGSRFRDNALRMRPASPDFVSLPSGWGGGGARISICMVTGCW
ncbi:hypothetical protein BDW69DRAFT_171340 [Aspergillus filifer]